MSQSSSNTTYNYAVNYQGNDFVMGFNFSVPSTPKVTDSAALTLANAIYQAFESALGSMSVTVGKIASNETDYTGNYTATPATFS